MCQKKKQVIGDVPWGAQLLKSVEVKMQEWKEYWQVDTPEKRCYIILDFDTKLISTAESSDNDKTYVLPDENFITVGDERFRFAEVLFQANFSA